MKNKQIEFTLERAETIELTGERAQSLYEKNNCSYPNVGDNVSIFTTHVSNRRQHRESVWVGKVIEVFVTHTDSDRCGGVCLTCSWCALKNDILLVT